MTKKVAFFANFYATPPHRLIHAELISEAVSHNIWSAQFKGPAESRALLVDCRFLSPFTMKGMPTVK